MAEESVSLVDTIENVVGGASAAFGVAGLLAPRALAGVYGMTDPSGNFLFLARLWGTRTGLLGGLLLAAPASERRRLLTAATAMNAIDAVVALTSGGLSVRTRLLAAATSGAFAAAGGFALTKTD